MQGIRGVSKFSFKQFHRCALWAVCLSVSLCGSLVPVTWLMVSDSWLADLGSMLHFSLSAAAGISLLAILCFLLLTPVWVGAALFRKSWRPLIGYAYMVSLCFGIIGFPLARKADQVYYEPFRKLAETSKPLVRAIETYELEHGKPPESLAKLVPKYLQRIPTTGLRLHPDYEYQTGKQAESYGNHRWVLVVTPPPRGFSWDLFLYFPEQDYPERGFGGRLERMGQWAYVHE